MMDATRKKRAEMYMMSNSGIAIAEIAKHFGLSRSIVHAGIAEHKRATISEERSSAAINGVRSYGDFLNIDVNDLGLPVRAVNCLKQQKIKTVADLIATPDTVLMRVPNFGKRSLEEIRNAVNALAEKHDFPNPATPIKNIEPKSRNPSELLQFTIQILSRMAEEPTVSKDDLIDFLRKLERHI
jgi:DNA-directed RNA polymerase alpha subunit